MQTLIFQPERLRVAMKQMNMEADELAARLTDFYGGENVSTKQVQSWLSGAAIPPEHLRSDLQVRVAQDWPWLCGQGDIGNPEPWPAWRKL